jgi:hypothetical protein
MNNNDTRHPAQKSSGPNKYLQLALLTNVPLTIHFADGEVISECLLIELDTLNLLVRVVSSGTEMVITRSTIKKIVTAQENECTKNKGVSHGTANA